MVGCRKLGQSGAREKTITLSVPRSDTGTRGGESQGLSGSTDVREFGKLVPYVRNKGCLPRREAGRSDSGAPTV